MIQYFINEKKKTVTARFENNFEDTDQELWGDYLVQHIHKILKSHGNFLRSNEAIYKMVYKIVGEVDSYCGIAQCNGDDAFDVEKGKELAKKRLLKKYYDTQKNVMLKFYEIMSKTTKEFLHDFNVSENKATQFKLEIDSFKK